jgi:hypothetical protein
MYTENFASTARKEELAVADYLCGQDAKRVLASHGFLDHPP